jgi:hypothetical protein
MESLIKYFAGEGRIIRKVPMTFSLGIAMLGGVIWAVVNWQYSEQIMNLNSRISLRDDQIEDYKSKLDEATRDEERKRFELLARDKLAPPPRR